MATFRIIFSGLCAIVPRDGSFVEDPIPPHRWNKPDFLTVLLPNVLEPCYMSEADIIIPTHYPLLEFDTANLGHSGNPPEFFTILKGDNRGTRGLSLLHFVDIYFLLDGAALPQEETLRVHAPGV